MGDIVIVGSLNTDLVVQTERFPQPGETLHGSPLVTSPGGKSSNQAAAAARLGGAVRLIGAVGDDDNGRMLIAAAQSAGVDTDAVALRPGTTTGTAVITVDARGENTIVISAGANGTLSPADVDQHRAVFDGAAVLGLCLEVDVETVLAAARAGHEAGLVVLTNLSPFADVPDELLELTDIVLLNQHEAALVLDGGDDSDSHSDDDDMDHDALAAALAARGVHRFVVTHGSAGCTVFGEQAAPVTVASPRVTAVDTTGCGDAFMGALALRLAEGDDLVGAARYAVRVASFAATRAGAQSSYPTPTELGAFA
ncbi:ribokinase [Frondihabitans sp. PAMC 28766]|uniref:ribokinase n=1 Tax=Frondihabitans sp. PAMC 28766 TaxID=1795630 RepID=UPI00078B9B6C|nr:ribokinase [Frondihabitans sp. PAMC 28766]AMM19510.1 ribokinase [Frondihabitans sp. PAMC 28766]